MRLFILTMRLLIILSMLISIIAIMHAETPLPMKVLMTAFSLIIITANAREL